MEEAKDVLTSIPAWGIFAFLVIKLVLDFLGKREEKASKEAASQAGFQKLPTPEEIAALIRDQQERQEILEALRASGVTTQQLTSLLGKIASAQERIAITQDRANIAAERQVQRTKALAEAIATSRQTMERLLAVVTVIDQDQDQIFAALEVKRRRDRDSETTPISVPIPTPSNVHRTVG